TLVSFDVFQFDPRIQAGIVSAGYSTPTPIQKQTIQPVLDGHDVLGLAQTGTGKTAAFVLPILQHLMDGHRGRLQALVLSPTRELAEQTFTVFRDMGRKTGLRTVTIYGGVSQVPQIRGVRGGAEIAVACPGRLLDLIGQGVVDLSRIETLVIDEADQMFDMGFMPSIRRIIDMLPKKRQTLFFSATMPKEIRGIAMELLHDPVTVEIGDSKPAACVQQTVFRVRFERKYETLIHLLNEANQGQVLVFARTKHRAQKLAVQLGKTGIPATSLQGNLSQNQRQAAMSGFRSGKVRVMVATDIAARGIDVTQITHVINYDVPDTAEAYTHRIGRTGRMSRLGMAYTLATQEDVTTIRTIERYLGHPLPSQTPVYEGEPMVPPEVIQSKEPEYDTPRRPAAPRRQGGRPNGRRQFDRRSAN
ncbi:MAG TPA: DEAD/DEAH box helicase, partial [Longilinea sp.]|nr:DEAD/DEAH box helicase [Longilinea sp.]